jgi:hypothetical protein
MLNLNSTSKVKMSQRMGMADGRCFTINTSSQLLNDYIMKTNKIAYEDNYAYRKLLQSKGPELLDSDTKITGCNVCHKPLLQVPDIY